MVSGRCGGPEPPSGTSFTQTAIFTGADYYRIGARACSAAIPFSSEAAGRLVLSDPSGPPGADAPSPEHSPWGPRDPGRRPDRRAGSRLSRTRARPASRSSSPSSARTGTRTTSATRGRRAGTRATTSSRPKKSPVVAVEDGKIKFWTTSARAGCMLYLYGASGTTYLYIHLNNDVTMANDNRGKCVAGGSYWPGLKDGAKVVAGQAIGFVGDSGDADGTPHLHFEVHPHDGAADEPVPVPEHGDADPVHRPAGERGHALAEGVDHRRRRDAPDDEGADGDRLPVGSQAARAAQADDADADADGARGRARVADRPRASDRWSGSRRSS